jgi:hypothetical protein
MLLLNVTYDPPQHRNSAHAPALADMGQCHKNKKRNNPRQAA